MRNKKADTLAALISDLTSCFENLVRLGKKHGSVSKTGNSFWGILKILNTHGPMTVPNLAKQRKLTRQRIQVLVDEYVLEGYLELTDNPKHKTSKLVKLTPLGKSAFDQHNLIIKTELHALAEYFDEEEGFESEEGGVELGNVAVTRGEVDELPHRHDQGNDMEEEEAIGDMVEIGTPRLL